VKPDVEAVVGLVRDLDAGLLAPGGAAAVPTIGHLAVPTIPVVLVPVLPSVGQLQRGLLVHVDPTGVGGAGVEVEQHRAEPVVEDGVGHGDRAATLFVGGGAHREGVLGDDRPLPVVLGLGDRKPQGSDDLGGYEAGLVACVFKVDDRFWRAASEGQGNQ